MAPSGALVPLRSTGWGSHHDGKRLTGAVWYAFTQR